MACLQYTLSQQTVQLKTWNRYGMSTIYIVTADSTVEDVESLWHVYNIHCLPERSSIDMYIYAMCSNDTIYKTLYYYCY